MGADDHKVVKNGKFVMQEFPTYISLRLFVSYCRFSLIQKKLKNCKVCQNGYETVVPITEWQPIHPKIDKVCFSSKPSQPTANTLQYF